MTIIFGGKAKLFGWKPAAKNEKYILYLLNEKKRNSFPEFLLISNFAG